MHNRSVHTSPPVNYTSARDVPTSESMIEESETPNVDTSTDVKQDALAERRARRAEAGDPVALRRADAAEAAVRNLETHLTALEQRLEEVGNERERIARQLTEREREVRSVKQHEYAEQQLRVEAEERSERIQREMSSQIQELRQRLEETDRHARELRVELDSVRERDEKLASLVHELMDVAAGLRAGFERELAELREELQRQVVWERETYVRELTAVGARMEDMRFELAQTATELRAQLSAEAITGGTLLHHTIQPDSEREAAHRQEMADALATAVERLRARVVEVEPDQPLPHTEPAVVEPPAVEPPVVHVPAVVEPVAAEPVVVEPTVAEEPPVVEPLIIEPPAVEPELSIGPPPVAIPEPPLERPNSIASTVFTTVAPSATGPVVLQPRALPVPSERVSWLAPAIRRLAEQRDAKLAAELVIELLPAQRQVLDGSLRYGIKIDELGAFQVDLDADRGTVSRGSSSASLDFLLEGSAAALSELAGGGTTRRKAGLRIRQGRRRARRLLKARRRPVALADLAVANIDMWPGLLLLAMAEAIDPSWTVGRRFELAFEIADHEGIVIYVRICDGDPILVSRSPTGKPVATVVLNEHALMLLLAGVPASPEHQARVHGDVTSVEMFLQWTARAQGLSS